MMMISHCGDIQIDSIGNEILIMVVCLSQMMTDKIVTLHDDWLLSDIYYSPSELKILKMIIPNPTKQYSIQSPFSDILWLYSLVGEAVSPTAINDIEESPQFSIIIILCCEKA